MSLKEMQTAAEENQDIRSGQKSAWYKVAAMVQHLSFGDNL